MDRSTWIYICMAISAVTAFTAGLLTRLESNEFSKRNRDQLATIQDLQSKLSVSQSELQRKTVGGDELPAILVLRSRTQIGLEIVTKGSDPLVNVRIKYNEVVLPDLGLVYPEVTRRFFDDEVPMNVDSTVYNPVIWYNNTKTLLAKVIVNRVKDGFLNSRVEFID